MSDRPTLSKSLFRFVFTEDGGPYIQPANMVAVKPVATLTVREGRAITTQTLDPPKLPVGTYLIVPLGVSDE